MISVLVPYRPDGGHRDRAWSWIRRRWELTLPGAEVIVQEAPPGADPGEFNHPWAINRAADRATGEVFVVADADTAFDPAWVHEAASQVGYAIAPWVLPRFYDQVNEQSTEQLLAGDPAEPIGEYEVGWRGDSVSWSGLVVVPRAGFELVGGYDERFEFWGADDVCFGLTMDALWGRHLRLPGAATHFWHPAPQEQTYGHERHAAQHQLMERYTAAAEDADALRAVRFG